MFFCCASRTTIERSIYSTKEFHQTPKSYCDTTDPESIVIPVKWKMLDTYSTGKKLHEMTQEQKCFESSSSTSDFRSISRKSTVQTTGRELWVKSSCEPSFQTAIFWNLGDWSGVRDTVDSFTSYSSYAPVPMTKIRPNLYIGTYDDAVNESALKANKISHVLSLIGHRSPANFVEHAHVPMDDFGRSDLKRVLKKVATFVEKGQQNGNTLLVHCKSGQNRSATLVIALLMMNQKLKLYLAYKEVKVRRPIVQINTLYARKLLRLEKEIFGKNSLPSDWMEREYDESTSEVTFKHEHVNMVNMD